jgi:hypothetical protein
MLVTVNNYTSDLLAITLVREKRERREKREKREKRKKRGKR